MIPFAKSSRMKVVGFLLFNSYFLPFSEYTFVFSSLNLYLVYARILKNFSLYTLNKVKQL